MPDTTVHAATVSTRQQRRAGVGRAATVAVAALLLVGVLPPPIAAAAEPDGPSAGLGVEAADSAGTADAAPSAGVLAVAAGGGALVILAGGLILVRAWHRRRERPGSAGAVNELPFATEPASLADPEQRLADALASASGRRSASSSATPLPQWVRRLDPDLPVTPEASVVTLECDEGEEPGGDGGDGGEAGAILDPEPSLGY